MFQLSNRFTFSLIENLLSKNIVAKYETNRNVKSGSYVVNFLLQVPVSPILVSVCIHEVIPLLNKLTLFGVIRLHK